MAESENTAKLLAEIEHFWFESERGSISECRADAPFRTIDGKLILYPEVLANCGAYTDIECFINNKWVKGYIISPPGEITVTIKMLITQGQRKSEILSHFRRAVEKMDMEEGFVFFGSPTIKVEGVD
jgi:hypothetical protein